MDNYQINHKILVDNAREVVRLAEERLRHLIRDCAHSIIKKNLAGVCEVCGERFGWYCPESPDHSCHYYSRISDGKRVVLLRDGTDHFLPEETHPKTENECDDYCLFCGEPDERT